MATNEPSVSTKNSCRCLQMGPLSLPNNAADGHVWALYFYQVMPLILHGPIITANSSINGHEWALCFYEELPPMPLNLPIVAVEHSADGNE